MYYINILKNISVPPTVKSNVETVAAEEGKEVTLTCDVEGNPEPEIIWTHEGTDTVLGVGRDLTIKNLTIDHTGRYTCRAVAQGFKEVTVHFLLFVKGELPSSTFHLALLSAIPTRSFHNLNVLEFWILWIMWPIISNHSSPILIFFAHLLLTLYRNPFQAFVF